MALVAQPVLAENVWSNPHAVASSERWSGLKSAKDGGPNVAYVDKAGLSATEVAEIKQLPSDAKAKGCTLTSSSMKKTVRPQRRLMGQVTV